MSRRSRSHHKKEPVEHVEAPQPRREPYSINVVANETKRATELDATYLDHLGHDAVFHSMVADELGLARQAKVAEQLGDYLIFEIVMRDIEADRAVKQIGHDVERWNDRAMAPQPEC